MRASKKLLFIGLLAVVASAIGQASAAPRAGTSVRCSWQTHAQSEWYRVQGTAVGSVTCSRPLGAGRYHGSYRARVTPPTASETGSSKLAFKAGTVAGSYRVSGAFSGSTHYLGMLRVLGGTGQFKHVTGTLRISCVIHVPTESCHASGTLKRL